MQLFFFFFSFKWYSFNPSLKPLSNYFSRAEESRVSWKLVYISQDRVITAYILPSPDPTLVGFQWVYCCICLRLLVCYCSFGRFEINFENKTVPI